MKNLLLIVVCLGYKELFYNAAEWGILAIAQCIYEEKVNRATNDDVERNKYDRQDR